MRLAVLIPDRGDRPEFLKNCIRMMEAQTLKPEKILIVNDTPISDDKDITWRYRIGYDRLRKQGFEVIAFIENDDWYSKDYLEIMVNKWIEAGKPNIFGTDYTIYYHIKERQHFIMLHNTRSSAMSTLIVPDLNFPWCPDNEPYTDIWLFNKIQYKVFKPNKVICIGIKHGVGKCGGHAHIDRLDRYQEKDPDMKYLQSILDKESFDFYSNYFK